MKIERAAEPKAKELVCLKNTEHLSVEFLNSGSTMINLAGSNKGLSGGWARGRIINFVGDGSSGKTLMALELAAYVFYNMLGNKSHNFPDVKKVRIIYDNTEGVMDFPIDQMYGQDFVDGVEWISSKTVQGFGRNIAREVGGNKPGEMLLYIVDSLDALASQEGLDRFEKAAKTDKEEDGTYGTEKAAYLSKSFFCNMCSIMERKDVTVLIISQIRQKIGVTFGEKYNRAGGKALDFYTHQVCWFAEIEKIKKTFRGEDRVIGVRTIAKFKRNKVAKPFREATLLILFDYGVDDIGSNLAYLYGPKVKALEWDGEDYKRSDLIKKIEDEGLQKELAMRTEEYWLEIEEAVKPNRLKRY